MNKTLVVGWFSFEEMGATAGDLIARDVVCEWLTELERPFDVAGASPFVGVDWRTVDPGMYGVVVFVCGPFGNGWPITELLERFAGTRLVGINVSMLEPLDVWNPFDMLIERDSSRTSRPDISFLSDMRKVPLAGVVLVHQQTEYPGAMHQDANAAIERLLATREIVRVPIDTRLDTNSTGLRTPAEVESLIAAMDVVVTTRLHGTALAIKNGVPPVVIDPIAGGRKVLSQARTIGWKVAFAADELDDHTLRQALDYCLSDEGRAEVLRVRERVIEEAMHARNDFITAMSPAEAGSPT